MNVRVPILQRMTQLRSLKNNTLKVNSNQMCSSFNTYSCPHYNAAPSILYSFAGHYWLCERYKVTLWMMMDSLLMMLLHKMNLFVSYFVKQMNLKSIHIVTVVLASIIGFVFTFVLMWNGGYGDWKECYGVMSNWLHLIFHMRIHNWTRFPMLLSNPISEC